MDLSVRHSAYGMDDQSWLGSAHGTDAAHSITIDVTTFTAATHYPDGALKSGLPLAVTGTTADGFNLYGLWTDNDTTPVDLAGFLLTPVAASSDQVGGALMEHGRVITDLLPVPVDDAAKASVAGRIIFA